MKNEELRMKNVPDVWFLVLGSWFLVLGSWFLVLGAWFLVLGSTSKALIPKHQAPGSFFILNSSFSILHSPNFAQNTDLFPSCGT
ncbi:MAG TPA: hypothetical protein PLS70_19775 [Acidobacteriota bacterium]|nr:hypothetical protein [Acidobacteriota bacterium]